VGLVSIGWGDGVGVMEAYFERDELVVNAADVEYADAESEDFV